MRKGEVGSFKGSSFHTQKKKHRKSMQTPLESICVTTLESKPRLTATKHMLKQ